MDARLAAGTAYANPVSAVIESRLAAHDVPGQHLWTMLAAWRVADPREVGPPGREYLLDGENLVSLVGPGCLKCEAEYSPQTAARPCTGGVSELQ
jgi:hypothetical protein